MTLKGQPRDHRLSQANTALWSELLLRSMAELRELFSACAEALDAGPWRTFRACLKAPAGWSEMLGAEQTTQPPRPDERTGCHPRLCRDAAEDLGAEQSQLDDGLARLLKAVQAAQQRRQPRDYSEQAA